MMMMIITRSFSTFLKTFLVGLLLVINIYGANSKFAGYCMKEERRALLEFKSELIDDSGLLSGWGNSSNCCEWKGVFCDNRSNHVIALDLHANYDESKLRGKISPSLLRLPHLRYLDLSYNSFNFTTIPSFIGSLRKLRHLNLGSCDFVGPIPHQLRNLSMIRFLDVSHNAFNGVNLEWLSGFQSLEYLRLSRCYVGNTSLRAIQKLARVKEIHMSQCGLTVIEPLVLNHSNHLRVLDLSSNNLDSSVLHRFLDASSVFTYIDFSGNGIQGRIPDALGNSTSLSHLDLSYNQLHGEFPRPLKNSLTYLDMSSNNFDIDLPRLFTGLHNATRLKHLAFRDNLLTGSFPNISRFSVLTRFSLRNNRLSGPLVEGNLMLPNLEALNLFGNRFTGEFPGNFSLPNLESLDLSNNKFTGRLANLSSCPSLLELAISNNAFTGSLIGSIQHIFKIEWLDAGYNKFEDVITEAHLSSLPRLRGLELSFNLNITMRINHSWIHAVRFHVLKLANCKLGPNFPKWLQKHNHLELLDISNSGISDSIPAWFWGNVYNCLQLNMSNNRIYGTLPDLSPKLYDLEVLDLSSNELTGLLPNLSAVFSVDLSRNKFSGPILDFCRSPRMFNFLDLSSNLLSGEIPQECFVKLLRIDYLNLANNNLTWEISTAGNFKCYVSSLHLRNNSFKGEIPRSLLNCSRLKILDLGENELSGEVHKWLATSMPYLVVLILKSNKIYGSLPSSICRLASIQVLDISSNKISGTIPKCINNFTQLGLQEDTTGSWVDMFSIQRRIDSAEYFRDSASVIWKGNEETYINTLGLVKMIDLSGNELTGVIPDEITSLHGLLGLNLSRNNLVGLIPHDIDRMRLLNFLDLSGNNLSGGIPPTLSKLSHLGILKLSFNNLSGRIPWDAHMQTFGASAYSGNPELCGPPLLSSPCPSEDHEKQDDDDGEEEEWLITRGFYISMLIGFGVAFWVVFWALFFNKRWNASTMRIYFVVADWLYVIVLVNKRRLLSYLGNA